MVKENISEEQRFEWRLENSHENVCSRRTPGRKRLEHILKEHLEGPCDYRVEKNKENREDKFREMEEVSSHNAFWIISLLLIGVLI